MTFFHFALVSAFFLFAFSVRAFSFRIDNPLNAPDLPTLIEHVTNAVISIGIPLAAVALIWGGFRFVSATSSGNEVGLKQARTFLWWTIIGATVVVGGAALVYAALNFAKTLG